jgi:hypothetical protein
VKAVLGDDVLLMRRERPLYHVRLQPVDETRHLRHALTRPPSIEHEIYNYWQLNICNRKYLELTNGSSPVRCRRQTWRSGCWRTLEEAELPHHPVDDVLLDIDVEDQSSPRHPVRLVSGAQDDSPCGAQAATMAGAYDVHRT